MKKIILIILILTFSTFSFSKEHEIIKGLKGFKLLKEKIEDYGEIEFTLKEGKKKVRKKIGGKYYEYKYISDEEKTEKVSLLSIIKNYKDEALKSKGEILSETKTAVNFRITLNSGKTIWCYVSASNSAKKTTYTLRIVEEGEINKILKFGEEEIAEIIEKDGKISLYGIVFDKAKGDLRTESQEELFALVNLMKNNEELQIEIQGHTDSDGDDGYNLKLSQDRAENVKKFLELFGIEQERITAKGYGETVPIAENTTDEGKAKNRRVDIVKLN